MSQPRTDILFPVGRLVMGNLYEPSTKDAAGNPLTVKTGPNKGQPRVDFFFAVAIAKGTETHWAYAEWGGKIWGVGHAFMAQAGQMGKNFAWKIVDGDSQEPNKRGVKPCTREGYAGHWIVHFSSGFAAKIFNRDGSQPMPEVDAVNPGDYVQVLGSCSANGEVQNPGVYLNHSLVAFQGYGPRITFGPDAGSVGFGQGALPAGASATPIGGMAPPAAPGAPAAPMAAPGAPMPPAPGMGAPAAPLPTAPAPALPPPHAGFIPAHTGATVGAPPPNPAIPPTPGMAPAPPGPAALTTTYPSNVMTAAANGMTYEQWRGAGWSDEQLLAHGKMIRQ